MSDIPPGWIALVVVIIGVFGTGGYFAQRGKNRNDSIDQYQEDKAADRLRLTELEVRQRLTEDYVYVLRMHIADGKPPPPPPFPPGLLGGH